MRITEFELDCQNSPSRKFLFQNVKAHNPFAKCLPAIQKGFIWCYTLSIYRGTTQHDITHSTANSNVKTSVRLNSNPRKTSISCHNGRAMGVFPELFEEKWPRDIWRALYFITGNMWAQEWQNIADLVMPYPEVEVHNVTERLIQHNYTVQDIFRSEYTTMMTSSNGNVFRVTGQLWGEFTGDRWIPLTKASDAELWCFLWSASE